MKNFNCPSNPDVIIKGTCVISECPYNYERTKDLFESNAVTHCFALDSPDVYDKIVSSRNKVTAMIRNSGKKIPESKLRKEVDASTLYATAVCLLSEVPSVRRCYCGRKQECKERTAECEGNRLLLGQLLNHYGLTASPSRITQAQLCLENNKLSLPASIQPSIK